MVPRLFPVVVAAGLAVTAAPARGQFFPGFRPGLYYTTPFGSVGFGYTYHQSLNYQMVNPYTGQYSTINLMYNYAGPAPFGAYAQQAALYQNPYLGAYSPYLGNSYL